MPNHHKMQSWIEIATSKELDALADAAEVSRAYLYQIAKGQRVPSSDVAGRLATASAMLNRIRGGGLPDLCRTDLSPDEAAAVGRALGCLILRAADGGGGASSPHALP